MFNLIKHSCKAACLFAACLLLVSCGNAMENKVERGRMAKLCYVPFDVSTSAPMTKANFSHSCGDIGEMNVGDPRFSEIMALIEQAEPGPFLDNGIRVGITLPDSSIVLIDDAGGVVLRGSQVKLDQPGFSRIRNMITKVARDKGLPESQ